MSRTPASASHASDLERIFEPFERAAIGRRELPARGSGLTITKLLTGVLGGELSVEERTGPGKPLHGRGSYISPESIRGGRRRLDEARVTMRILGRRRLFRALVAWTTTSTQRNLRAPICSGLLGVDGVAEAANGADCWSILPLGCRPDVIPCSMSRCRVMDGWEDGVGLLRERRMARRRPIIMVPSADAARPRCPASDLNVHDHDAVCQAPFASRDVAGRDRRSPASAAPAGPPRRAPRRARGDPLLPVKRSRTFSIWRGSATRTRSRNVPRCSRAEARPRCARSVRSD